MNGKSQPKSISKAFPIERIAFEVLILAIFGAAAIVLRANLRIPLQMPGHHGLEIMALLLVGRSFSKMPIASSISTLAAALLIVFPFMGFKDPFLPAIYMLLGAVIDLSYRFFAKHKNNLLFYAMMGGLAYACLPLSRILIHFTTGYHYASFFRDGYFYPVISHFLFGASGGLLAAGLIISARRIKKQ